MTLPLKWHGGKHYLATRIVKLFPPRCQNPISPATDDPGYLHYVEPYLGGGAVLLANDPQGISECVNDIHGALIDFWRTLQDDGSFTSFVRQVEAIPFSENEWKEAGDDAVGFFVRCRQSLSGRMDAFASVSRSRTRRGMNEQVSAWLNAIEGLPEVHSRLKRVLILNRKAIDVITSEDGKRSLFYLDPPYLHETRVSTSEYEHEMTTEDHVELLDVISAMEGRFLLSGYRSELYDDYASRYSWTRHEFELPNNAASGITKRRMIECVWMNY